MRKILSVMPLLFLTLILCGPAHAAGTSLNIHAPDQPVRTGETFSVRVDLEGSPGLTSVQFTLTFDRGEMICTGAAAGPLLDGALSQTNPHARNGAALAAASAETMEGDGTLAEFTFRAETDLSGFRFGLEGVYLGDGRGQMVPVSVNGQDTGGSAETETPASEQPPVSVRPRTSGGTSGRSGASSAPDPVPALDAVPQSDAVPPAIPAAEPEEAQTPAAPEEAASGGTASAPERRNVLSFTDTAGHWAEKQIVEAAARGLFGGYPDGTFRPDRLLTRAQYVKVLWNLYGRPEPDGTAPFTDLDGVSGEFRSAITWAFRNGYVNGTTPVSFSPNLPVTRQAAMKILFSVCGGESGAETLFFSVYDADFADSGRIAAWARSGVYWAVYHDILRGTASDTLSPDGFVTRAQMAVIMVRCTDRFPVQTDG